MKELALIIWFCIAFLLNAFMIGVFIAELGDNGMTKTAKYILCFLCIEFALLTLYCFW